jgi:hypothetical protein
MLLAWLYLRFVLWLLTPVGNKLCYALTGRSLDGTFAEYPTGQPKRLKGPRPKEEKDVIYAELLPEIAYVEDRSNLRSIHQLWTEGIHSTLPLPWEVSKIIPCDRCNKCYCMDKIVQYGNTNVCERCFCLDLYRGGHYVHPYWIEKLGIATKEGE